MLTRLLALRRCRRSGRRVTARHLHCSWVEFWVNSFCENWYSDEHYTNCTLFWVRWWAFVLRKVWQVSWWTEGLLASKENYSILSSCLIKLLALMYWAEVLLRARLTSALVQVIASLHVLATCPMEQLSALPFKQRVWWAPETVWKEWKSETSCLCLELNPSLQHSQYEPFWPIP
jgi:hypothetical protein